jgi:hypothetical protein
MVGAVTTIVYSSSIDRVDWAALKAALARDDFDNGRSPQEYKQSHENSHAVIFGYLGSEIVANGRILSDAVCNAYLVDIWTATPHRRLGVGREVVARLVSTVPGQHVGLFSDNRQDFYTELGFRPQRGGMSQVIGTWLSRD